MSPEQMIAAVAYGRARKAARLALTLTKVCYQAGIHDPAFVVGEESVRGDLARLCHYDHVSADTWEMVLEMLKETE